MSNSEHHTLVAFMQHHCSEHGSKLGLFCHFTLVAAPKLLNDLRMPPAGSYCTYTVPQHVHKLLAHLLHDAAVAGAVALSVAHAHASARFPSPVQPWPPHVQTDATPT